MSRAATEIRVATELETDDKAKMILDSSGAFIGNHVRIGQSVTLRLDSAFT